MEGFEKIYRVPAVVLAMLCTLFGCGNADRPENILSRDEMVRVLTEVYIAEEKVNRLGLTHDSAVKVFDHIEPLILEKAGVTDSLFRPSLDYYTDRPREMQLIYTAVVDSLQVREQRAQPEQQ